eukprot:TRINITY_DN201_c0_g1_i2.p1 TRINITY_DN201_c0_g1~~TRINITY_DN201_c0_g1_i2.p1  ORF type:complete len:170 (+),score=21.77 TRINITY_DN201_c0_g1_i2:220-729(+)
MIMHASVLVLSLAAFGEASMESLQACLTNKIKPAIGPCGTGMVPRCTPECKSAIEEVVAKLDGSCCSEAPPNFGKLRCESEIKGVGPSLTDGFRHTCPDVLDDFTVALSEMLPFDFRSDDEPAAAVVKVEPANSGTIAVGAAAAGAVGASVALAIASWSSRKHDALLAN